MSEEPVLDFLRVRFNHAAEQLEAIEHQLAELHAGIERDFASVNQRLDKIERRIARIERRS